MGKLRERPDIQKKISRYLAMRLPEDDPRWFPIRRFVNDEEWAGQQSRQYAAKKADVRHRKLADRLRKDEPLYTKYVAEGFTYAQISQKVGHDIRTVGNDLMRLGLHTMQAARYQVIDPKASTITYYSSQVELAKALHVDRRRMFGTAGHLHATYNGKEVRSGRFVHRPQGWHEVTV